MTFHDRRIVFCVLAQSSYNNIFSADFYIAHKHHTYICSGLYWTLRYLNIYIRTIDERVSAICVWAVHSSLWPMLSVFTSRSFYFFLLLFSSSLHLFVRFSLFVQFHFWCLAEVDVFCCVFLSFSFFFFVHYVLRLLFLYLVHTSFGVFSHLLRAITQRPSVHIM